MKKIAAALYSWGEYKIQEIEHNPYPDTNILYRYGVEGEVQGTPSRDKVLCFDPQKQPKYIIDINSAWRQLSEKQRECVFGKYVVTQMVDEDGRPYTANQVASLMNISVDTFNRNVSRGRREIDLKVKL